MIIDYPNEFEKSKYHNTFIGFTGDTGADLNYRDPDVERKALWLDMKFGTK